MGILLLVALVLWKITPRFEETIVVDEDPEATKILFIGNSLTFLEHVPAQVVDIAKAQDESIKLVVKQVAYPDYTLKDHWNRKRAKAAIESQNWDYVVLQGHSQEPIKHPKLLRQYAKLFDEEVREAHGKTVLYATWTDFDKLELHDQILKVFKNLSNDADLTLAPVGEALFLCLEEYPDIKLLREDRHHATDSGAYLVAATLYTTIFKKKIIHTPENMTYSQINVDIPTKKKLDGVALEACLKHHTIVEPVNPDAVEDKDEILESEKVQEGQDVQNVQKIQKIQKEQKMK